MRPPDKPPVFVEVYQALSTLAAHKILDVVLQPEGIEGIIHDRSDEAFPARTQPGGYFVAVREEDAPRALAILKEALDNGFLDPTDGTLLTPLSTP